MKISRVRSQDFEDTFLVMELVGTANSPSHFKIENLNATYGTSSHSAFSI